MSGDVLSVGGGMSEFLLAQILEVERLRLRLEAAKTLHWARAQVTNTDDVVEACQRIMDAEY